MDRDAGSSLFARLRRLALLFAAAGTLAAPGLAPAADADDAHRLLMPVTVISGGLAAAPGLPPGFPPQHRPPGPAFVKLMFPTALAASASDVFVADSGLGALLRIDPLTHAVSSLRTIPVSPGVRLAATPDGSLYLLRPDRSEILRLARDGRTISTHADLAEVPQPVALVAEPGSNTLLVADASGELYAFGHLDAPAEPLPGSRADAADGPQISLLAAGRRTVAGYDAGCRCLVAIDRNGRLTPFGAGDDLLQPSAMILDEDERLWIVDAGDRLLKVYRQGEEIARIAPARLGLSQITALAAHHRRLYLADAPAGRIAVFDILPAAAGRAP